MPVESVAAFIVSADHGGNDTGDDEMIAHMLQHQYDREHDFQLAREASVFNGSSKCMSPCSNVGTFIYTPAFQSG